ncbi:MAG: hypothetical protein SOH99_11830 [Acidipropionibacterium acidipropionici]|jgi:hypothetical protein|uniref:hypothetical protein n=1 Tax=Acidipropionibacterium acidipropionici TaxID=1748 RepID=UPI002F35CF77
MKTMTPAAAIDRIGSATSARDLFEGSPADPAAARRARRTYRMLIALIHPDTSAAHGIPADAAGRAAARLNRLHQEWLDAGAAPRRTTTSAYVTGIRGTYLLGARLRRGRLISEYTTAERHLRVAICRTPAPSTDALEAAAEHLGRRGMAAFGPRIVDRGTAQGRAWVAYRLPNGLHTLAGVRSAYPLGLDGRDWAWMARRILIAMDSAGDPALPGLGLDTVLIEPEHHGVVLTGFGDDGPTLGDLFDAMLDADDDARRQRDWARAADSTHLSASAALHEYDLLLTRLYGARRYRRFSIPETA